MCNFGARKEWRRGRRAISSYIDSETIKYQYYMINPTPFECIIGYIMGAAFSDRYLKKMIKKGLESIDFSI